MKLSKRIAAFAAAMVMSVSAMGLSASAVDRAAQVYIGNCRTHPDLKKKDKEWVKLHNCKVTVDGITIDAGDMYGRLDYDIFGDDSIQTKVYSSLYKHDAITSTTEDTKATVIKNKGVKAQTSWVDLGGKNGTAGRGTFSATFYGIK